MYKIMIFVKQELKMPKGKMAGQVGHACCSLLFDGNVSEKEIQNYFMYGQKKVVCKVSNEEFEQIKQKSKGLPYVEITDAAHTFFSKPTKTVSAIFIEEHNPNFKEYKLM